MSENGVEPIGGKRLGLIEVCARCESVELWIEPEPNAQLVLLWLLDYFRSHLELTTQLVLCHVDATLGDADPKQLAKWRFPAVGISNDHFEIASLAWQAYRAPTPQAWFNLLKKDLSILPQLRRCVLELLEELPGRVTGLGASEMRFLELISAGYVHPYDLFPGHQKPNDRRVFGYWQVGKLLDGLAHCPAPAIAGLDEGPFDDELHDARERHDRYANSRLSPTSLGKAILAQAEDFSRHNPIHRWWGGTELTNDRLWRWEPALIAP